MTTDHAQARERLDRMFRDYSRSVYRFARQRVPAEDAEDIVCEVFVVAWRRLPEVPEAELGWLLGVARKKVAEYLRARRRRGALTERTASHAGGHGADHAHEVAGRAEVEWALSQVPAKDQEVLRLLVVDDLSVAEIAAALGCRPNTASVRLRRARARLAAVYARDAEGPGTGPGTAATTRPRPDPADPSTTEATSPFAPAPSL